MSLTEFAWSINNAGAAVVVAVAPLWMTLAERQGGSWQAGNFASLGMVSNPGVSPSDRPFFERGVWGGAPNRCLHLKMVLKNKELPYGKLLRKTSGKTAAILWAP